MIKDVADWPLDFDSLKGPATIRAVPWLIHDIRALKILTQGNNLPLLQRVRGQRTGRVMYRFGDASKAAFGTTVKLEDRLLYQYGQWSSEIV
jgi:hypothetical protein